MPSLSFLADEQDAKLLVERLNADPEVAFIVPDGPLDPQEAHLDRLRASMGDRAEATFYLPFGMADTGYRQRWKAVPTVAAFKDGKHSLWHVLTGPLPLLTEDGRDEVVPDPWAGWTEHRPGAEPTTPYFGSGNPAEIRMALWTRHRPYSEAEKTSLPVLISYWDDDHDTLVVSDFDWIGDHYEPAPQSTRLWWARMEAWIAENAAQVGDFTARDEDTGERALVFGRSHPPCKN